MPSHYGGGTGARPVAHVRRAGQAQRRSALSGSSSAARRRTREKREAAQEGGQLRAASIHRRPTLAVNPQEGAMGGPERLQDVLATDPLLLTPEEAAQVLRVG